MFYNIWISGSQYADNENYDFVFEKKIRLKEGFNHISLCSATVGLAVRMIIMDIFLCFFFFLFFLSLQILYHLTFYFVRTMEQTLIWYQLEFLLARFVWLPKRDLNARKFGKTKYILEDISMELDHSKWTNKVGLHGEEELKLKTHISHSTKSGLKALCQQIGCLFGTRYFTFYVKI